jgi:anti-anti-sigma factor
MAIVVHCPKCARVYHVSEEIVGRRVQCRQCGETFQASAAGGAQPAAPAAVEAGEPTERGGAHLEVQRAGRVTIVRVLASRINSDNVEAIAAELLALAADPDNRRMVLNLARVEFLFSTMLGTLVTLEKKLQGQRGSLRLCELQPLVRNAVESAGLTLILELFDTEQQAVASVGQA